MGLLSAEPSITSLDTRGDGTLASTSSYSLTTSSSSLIASASFTFFFFLFVFAASASSLLSTAKPLASLLPFSLDSRTCSTR